MADEAEQRAPERADADGDEQHAEPRDAGGEDPEQQAQHEPEPRAARGPAHRGAAVGDPAGDGLDGAHVVADDLRRGDGELLVGQRVDGGLRVGVLGVARDHLAGRGRDGMRAGVGARGGHGVLPLGSCGVRSDDMV
ncbi:hypothetical protein MT344_14830 [Clavibacter michiganensis subsp. phaseoli]|nr:hypothetical protein [Clavibacter phaseoli]